VLVGDSVADSASAQLPSEAAKHGISFSAATRSGCGLMTVPPVAAAGTVIPWGPNCAAQTARYESDAVTSSHAQVVVWLSTWEMSNHLFNGKIVAFGTPAADTLLKSELQAALDRMHASGATTLVLLTVPQPAEHSDRVVPSEVNIVRAPKLNKVFRSFAAVHPREVLVVDLANIVCPGGWPCPEFVDGIRPRPGDGEHFEGAGPAWLAPKLVHAITMALRKAATPAP
jgi:hypothetical protein